MTPSFHPIPARTSRSDFTWTITKNLHMVYLHCPRDLNNSLVEKTVQVGMCARKPPNVDQNADMTAQLVQHFAFACLTQKFIH